MDTPTTDTLRAELLRLRASLLEQLAQLRGGAVSRSVASENHFGQSQDSPAQVSSERELEFALDEHETSALAQIDAALNRIASGTYGRCADCGSPIPSARLQATPQVLRCIGCQVVSEQGQPH